MKKERIKGFATGVITTLLILAVSIPIFAAAQTININGGIIIKIDGQAFIPKDANGNIVDVFEYNGTTYVPLRALSQVFGKEIGWDSAARTVTLSAPNAPGTTTDAPTTPETPTTQPQKTAEELYQERYEAYMVEYTALSDDYDARISDLMREKQQYRDELFKRYMAVGNSYQAGLDADKEANKEYDPQISALQQEKSAAFSNLRIKYRI